MAEKKPALGANAAATIAERARIKRKVTVKTDPARPANALANIMSIAEQHIADLSKLQKGGDTLSLNDMKSLDLVSGVVSRIAREQREIDKTEDVADLDDETLLQEAQEALDYLKGAGRE